MEIPTPETTDRTGIATEDTIDKANRFYDEFYKLCNDCGLEKAFIFFEFKQSEKECLGALNTYQMNIMQVLKASFVLIEKHMDDIIIEGSVKMKVELARAVMSLIEKFRDLTVGEDEPEA